MLYIYVLARKAPNTTIAEFANTVDPDEIYSVCPEVFDFQHNAVSIESFFEILPTLFCRLLFWRFIS